jgi:hypothetical protein
MTIQCPHVIGGVRCSGSVEAVLPADAQAVAGRDKAPR